MGDSTIVSVIENTTTRRKTDVMGHLDMLSNSCTFSWQKIDGFHRGSQVRIALSPMGGYKSSMNIQLHATHPRVVKRLKRANGHLKSVIDMIEAGRSCHDVAQQLHAVEKAVSEAKKTLIRDHLDHCLDDVVEPRSGEQRATIDEFKAITKYL